MNISDDPNLADCLIYYVKHGKNKVGSDKAKNDILFKGLGMGEEHCLLVNKGDKTLHVEVKDSEKCKVLMNGVRIKGKAELHHLDRVVFGHGNSYKVLIPA